MWAILTREPSSHSPKGIAMNIPVETKPFLWGLAAGAVAMTIAGFTWGGWVTGSKSETAAAQRAREAVVGVLAPICVDKFQHASDAAANSVALKKTDSWSQAEFVEKGGWATVPGPANPDQVSAVAKACAALLTA
jgi:alpha/beta superfamily hydrolase